MTTTPMRTFIRNRHDLFIKDLKTIVDMDSSSDNKPGIEAVALFFKERFEALGLDTELLILGKEKVPCLSARNRSDDKPCDIMFLGHMDTVFATGEAAERPFTVKGDRAEGVGVCDMKGGLLVVLHALEALKTHGVLDRLSVRVTFNGDEETGSEASHKWIEDSARQSKRVFVFEPCRPGYRFVLRRKGGGWFYLKARGKAAHAGADLHLGANAVVELAHQAVAINRLNDPEKGTSAQVTAISGGDKVNIIPDAAEAAVDVRIPTITEMERVDAFFKALPSNTHVDGVSISVEGGIDRPPMEPDQRTLDLWELLKACGKKTGMEIDYISTGGCSDGNFTSAAGTPTIDGMGPVGANAHREDEYIDLSSIDEITLLVAEACSTIAEL